jgi:hypothetical protein
MSDLYLDHFASWLLATRLRTQNGHWLELVLTFTQLEAPQQDLSFSGVLAGMVRYAGGTISEAIYTTILVNTQSARAVITLPAAAIAAGMSPDNS